MSKIFKYISVFLLWIAGLSLSAHLIIPHDHHSAEIIIDQDEKCPASSHGSDNHQGFPIHCHAFNDLTSERSRPLLISENVQFCFVKFSIPTDTSIVISIGISVSYKEFSKPFPDSFILEFSSLRAPPSIA